MNTVYSLLFVSELISNPSSQSSVPTSLRASSLTETQRKGKYSIFLWDLFNNSLLAVAAEAILRVAATKGYTTLDDLYKLTYTDLKKSGGKLFPIFPPEVLVITIGDYRVSAKTVGRALVHPSHTCCLS